MDDDDFPEFLNLTAEQRAAAWRGRKLTTVRSERKRDYSLPRSIDAAGLAILRQIKRDKARKTKQRLAALKQLRAKRKAAVNKKT